MSKKIVVTLSDKNIELAKKLFDKSKLEPSFNLSFDEFLEKLIITSFDAHMQFSNINDNMMKMFTDSGLDLNNLKVDDTLKDMDDFVKNIFNKNNDEKNKETNKQQKENPNNTNKKKN